MKNYIKFLTTGLISLFVLSGCIYVGPGNYEGGSNYEHNQPVEIFRIYTEDELAEFLTSKKISKAKLYETIYLSNGITISSNEKILDLNGFSIESESYLFHIRNNAKLTIKNSNTSRISKLKGTYNSNAVILNDGILSIEGLPDSQNKHNIMISSNFMGIKNNCVINYLRCDIAVHATAKVSSVVGIYNTLEDDEYATINELDANIKCEYLRDYTNDNNDTTAVFNEGYIKAIRKGTYEAYSTVYSYGLFNDENKGADSGTIDLIESGVNFFADGVLDNNNVTLGAAYNSNEGRIKTNNGKFIPPLNGAPNNNIRSASETKPLRTPKRPVTE